MKKPILKTVSSTMQEKEKVRKIRDESLNTAISQIEQSYGKGSIMKLGDNKERADVDVISTGSIGLDIALGVGGLPRGRIIEIYGPESSGKTTLAIHALAECQKTGGTCAFYRCRTRTRSILRKETWRRY